MGRKEKTLLITIIANVVLIALRFFLADLSGSVGLAANAWHSMTDAFVTSVVFCRTDGSPVRCGQTEAGQQKGGTYFGNLCCCIHLLHGTGDSV